MLSLSARRAWIEISGVDFSEDWLKSLSARRAWIEMLASRLADMSAAVALRKESVDRNNAMNMTERNNDSRSPQGERG